MTKTELLALMRLLSALESWALSLQSQLPGYLHQEISRMQAVIEEEILT